MAHAPAAKVAVVDDALSASPVDATGLALSALVYAAIGMLRLSAIAALAAPLVLIAWLVL